MAALCKFELAPTCLNLPLLAQACVCLPLFIIFKAAGDKLLINRFIRQTFGGGLTLKIVIS